MPPKASFKSPSTPPRSRNANPSSSSASTAHPDSNQEYGASSPFNAMDSNDFGDQSNLMDLSQDLQDLHLATDTPSPNKMKSRAAAVTKKGGKVSKSRPSWGPPPTSTSNELNNTRLLAGLDTLSSTSGPRLGGMATSKTGSKPRFSLFAKPNLGSDADSRAGKLNNTLEEVEGSPVKGGDDSFLGGGGEDQKNHNNNPNTNASQEPTRTDPSQQESQEQVSNQLQELRRMNETFEQYEMSLLGVHDQMETFSDRISSTSRLLDIYIDLLRQSERTQRLLLDPEWKGATEDESAHAEMLAQARRDEARARAEAELAAAQAAEDARMEEERKREVEERRKLMESKGSSTRGRGAVRGVARGASTIRGTTRGAGTIARGASAGAARGRVTSSSIPARSTSGSGIARPSTTSASTRGRTASGGTGTGTTSTRATVRSSGYGPK